MCKNKHCRHHRSLPMRCWAVAMRSIASIRMHKTLPTSAHTLPLCNQCNVLQIVCRPLPTTSYLPISNWNWATSKWNWLRKKWTWRPNKWMLSLPLPTHLQRQHTTKKCLATAAMCRKAVAVAAVAARVPRRHHQHHKIQVYSCSAIGRAGVFFIAMSN